jgi:hypothetical protein
MISPVDSVETVGLRQSRALVGASGSAPTAAVWIGVRSRPYARRQLAKHRSLHNDMHMPY